MPNNIDNLLKKKGWTGKEVGKLLIASMLNDIKNHGNPDAQPLFSQKDFERMESSLTSDSDYTIYGVYRDLYSSIIDIFNWGQSLSQQFYNGYYRLLATLKETQNTDAAQYSLDNTPLIMTESQYKRLEAEAATSLRENTDSFSSILFHCLKRFLEADEKAPEHIPQAIKDALEAAKTTPVKESYFLPLYNDEYGEGYRQLPDGRRSDQMTREEWKKALELEYLKANGAEGQETVTIETFQQNAEKRLLRDYELFFKGADAARKLLEKNGTNTADFSDEDLEDAVEMIVDDKLEESPISPQQEKLKELLGYATLTEWHYYETPPEGLTAYDLLEIITDSFYYSETDQPKHIKAFKREYPELYKVLTAYIEELLPQTRGLKANQLYKDIASWGELADAGIVGYKEFTTVTSKDLLESCSIKNYQSRYRTVHNGIAIIKDPASSQVDENGDYIEPESPLKYVGNSLETLAEDTDRAEKLEKCISQLIYPSISYLYAFNALTEIFGKVYDLPELAETIKFDTSKYEEKIHAFNSLLYLFYHEVYGDTAERERKRRLIKKCFTPLDTESLKPTQEAINALTKELTKLGLSTDARKKLKYLDKLIAHLRNNEEGAC